MATVIGAEPSSRVAVDDATAVIEDSKAGLLPTTNIPKSDVLGKVVSKALLPETLLELGKAGT